MKKLLLDLSHMLNLVWRGISSRTQRPVVLDPEVDSCDSVFARKYSDLVSSGVLEARRRRVKYDHLILLPNQLAHMLLKPLLTFKN